MYLSNSLQFKPKSGLWYTENNKTMWIETDKYGNKIKEYNPLDIVNISRSASYKIVFLREYSDTDSFSGKVRKWFCQDVQMHLAENVADEIVIKFEPSSKKFFIMDLKPLGQKYLAPLESTPELIVTKSEPYPITQAQAKSYISEFSYGFSKITSDESGNVTEYITTV